MAARQVKTGRDFRSDPPGAHRSWFRPARILLGVAFVLAAIVTVWAGSAAVIEHQSVHARAIVCGEEILLRDKISYIAAFAYFLVGLVSCGFLAASLAALHLLSNIMDVLERIDYRDWRRHEGSS